MLPVIIVFAFQSAVNAAQATGIPVANAGDINLLLPVINSIVNGGALGGFALLVLYIVRQQYESNKQTNAAAQAKLEKLADDFIKVIVSNTTSNNDLSNSIEKVLDRIGRA